MAELPVKLFPSLISQLTKYGPTTYKLVGTLRVAVDGKRGVKCFTDGWPAFTTVVTDLTWPILCEDSYSAFSKDPIRCPHFLADNNIIDWTKRRVMFGGIEPSLLSVVADIAVEKGMRHRISGPYVIMEAQPGTFLQEELVPPAGFSFATLFPEHTPLVASTWEYTEEGTDEFIEFIIKNFITVSLQTSEGRTVGWIMEQPYGASGMLHVVEDFRGQGLSKLLVKKLRDELLAAGKPAYCYVRVDNEVSIHLHEACGYVNVDKTNTYDWFIADKDGDD